MRPVVATALVGATTAAACLLAGCTSTTSGSGRPGGTSGASSSSSAPAAPSSGASGSDGSTPVSSGAPSSATAPASSPTAQPKSVLTITGSTTHTPYRITVWDSDTITDCSTHAYGATMIRFLGAHPCRGAHRVLGTVVLGGRTVALSAVSTSFPGTPQDPYVNTAEFIKLENADGTGSINDLLREGGTLPGATAIPPTEAFNVVSQDAGVTVFDAWYLQGTTADQDPALLKLEQDLFLTAFTGA